MGFAAGGVCDMERRLLKSARAQVRRRRRVARETCRPPPLALSRANVASARASSHLADLAYDTASVIVSNTPDDL